MSPATTTAEVPLLRAVITTPFFRNAGVLSTSVIRFSTSNTRCSAVYPDAARLQVRDHHDLAADQGLGRVVLGDPGGQRARGVADLDPELQDLVRAGHPFRLEDLGHPKVDLAEVVDRDLAHSAPSFVDGIRAAGRVSIRGKSGAPCRMRAPAGSPPQREASGNRCADRGAGIPS